MPSGPWDDYKSTASSAPAGPWDDYKTSSAPVSNTPDAPAHHSLLEAVGHGANNFVAAGPPGQLVQAGMGVPDAIHHPIQSNKDLFKHTVEGLQAGDKDAHQIIPAIQHGDLGGAWSHLIGTIPILGQGLKQANDELVSAFQGDKDPVTGVVTHDPYKILGAVGTAGGLAWSAAAGLKHPKQTALDVPQGSKIIAKGVGESTIKTAKLLTEKAIDLGSNNVEPETLMMGALRGSASSGRVNFAENLRDNAMPAIRDASHESGRAVNGIDSLIRTENKPGLIDFAKGRIQNTIDKILGPQKAMGTQLSGKTLGDAIRGTITEKMKVEGSGKGGAVERVNKMADAYAGKNFTIDEAYKLLGDTNDELNGYYDKNPTARRRSSGSNPDIAHNVALANSLRDLLYKWEDDPAVGDALRGLRKQYGTLTELEDSLYRRRNVALRQAPVNLSSQLARWSGLGDMAKAVGHAAQGNAGSAAGAAMSGLTKMTVSKWMQDYISTDSLINRAFAKTVKPNPTGHLMGPDISPYQLNRPMLEAGPMRTPVPEDTSGPTGKIHMPEGVSTRLLEGPTQVQQPGFDVIDAVPVKNPKTGRLEYVPHHWANFKD